MINKHKSNKIKENSNTVRHLNNGTDHRHSKSCCDQSSPARRTIRWSHDHLTFIMGIPIPGKIIFTLRQGPGIFLSQWKPRIFKAGFWLAGSCSASQSKARLENPHKLTWISTWIFFINSSGPVTPYDVIELWWHGFRQWLVAWWHQALTWTNVD